MPLVLMSFLVGILIGLTSMGGAALMAPFLILILGVRPVTAVGTDLVYGAVTKLVATAYHLRHGTADLQIVWRLACGSLPAGMLGSALVFALPQLSHDADRFVQRAMGVLLVMVAAALVFRLVRPAPQAGNWLSEEFLRGKGCVIWGAVVGFCVGLTSVGSGSLLAPFLLLLFPKSPARVVGTDILHATLLVSTTGLVHMAGGHVEWGLVPSLLAGSIPGVLIGSRLAVHLPAKFVRASLAAVLTATGLRMI
jgi:uncharacterized membrane protein YfcA